jgi:ribonuclease D
MITHPKALPTVIAAIQAAPYITLDTEFRRQHTYYPELSLIQIAVSLTEIFIVDAVLIARHAEKERIARPLQPLLDALANPRVRKIVHASHQDLEIFRHGYGCVLRHVYDTQIAAHFCGFSSSVSYHTLVQHLMGVDLDKSCQNTPWMRRPLRPTQLAYAAEDVRYLYALYPRLQARLQAQGRAAWAMAEMACLEEAARYQPPLHKFFLRLCGQFVGKQDSLLRVYGLVHWREHTARTRNVPRMRVLNLAQNGHARHARQGALARRAGLRGAQRRLPRVGRRALDAGEAAAAGGQGV